MSVMELPDMSAPSKITPFAGPCTGRAIGLVISNDLVAVHLRMHEYR